MYRLVGPRTARHRDVGGKTRSNINKRQAPNILEATTNRLAVQTELAPAGNIAGAFDRCARRLLINIGKDVSREQQQAVQYGSSDDQNKTLFCIRRATMSMQFYLGVINGAALINAGIGVSKHCSKITW